jgi:hypothetical protein
MVPDVDVLDGLLANQDPQSVSVTLRGLDEMEDQRTLTLTRGGVEST